ncbi:MAG: GMC family oxidoreductase N-terminal domain-containing protein [Acidobacteria bacterium]|nr:GMC family oxidoreductase N-terminal domain-containing protein [Acidobacteriota bacterium]
MDEMYDLIVVGAGTAGCVLAERLTNSGKLRVLLLEAGGPPKNRFVSVPAGMAKLFKSEVDWAFESEPQTAIDGRRIFTPRGKMLGGSSNMNAQMHQWCHPADFDGWVEAGASGWGWMDVQPVFRAQERWLGEDGDPGRGRQGPMTISPNSNARPLSHAFVEAARQAGLGGAHLYNGHAYQGAWIAELAHKDGKRFSAYDAYLVPAMRRKNLEVMTDATVTKVVIDRGRAVGVTVRRGGSDETLTARGVVLSAGAFASPQLLMLSGIGPAAVLAKFGLPVHVDRQEVGENLQDHPATGIVCRTHSTDTLKERRVAAQPAPILAVQTRHAGVRRCRGIRLYAGPPRPGGSARPGDTVYAIRKAQGVPRAASRARVHHRLRRSGPAVPRAADFAKPRSARPSGHRLPPAQRSRGHRCVCLVRGHSPQPEDRQHSPARGAQRW